MGLNGFAITTLSGTPFDDHPGALETSSSTQLSTAVSTRITAADTHRSAC